MELSEKTNTHLTIYIPLKNEGVEVFRPTGAMAFGEGYYKVLPTPHYDPTDEEWQFVPETIVRGSGARTAPMNICMRSKDLSFLQRKLSG